jgi:hypothetical protein
MFRCHFTREGQIVWGDHLQASSLEEACAEARELLRQRADLELDGFEIWSGATLLFVQSEAAHSPLHGAVAGSLHPIA